MAVLLRVHVHTRPPLARCQVQPGGRWRVVELRHFVLSADGLFSGNMCPTFRMRCGGERKKTVATDDVRGNRRRRRSEAFLSRLPIVYDQKGDLKAKELVSTGYMR